MRRLALILTMALAVSGTRNVRDADQTAPRAAGSASISGTITSDADNRPIARAVVTLAGSTLRPAAVAITDANGRFAFTNLPSGLFTLTASKAPLLTMAYGQASPGRGSGLPISLADGQQVTGVNWKLPRGAVITGTVRDEGGRPMREVPIVLMQYRTVNDRRSLTNVACCVWPVTESDGSYRVAGILPGDYIVSAMPSGSYVFIPSGPFAGGGEVRSIDPAEMQWALRQIANSRTGGGNAGPPAPRAAEPPAGPTMSYARVYYPGTVDENAATTLTLRAGEERSNVDLLMKLERTARIEGRIVGPEGQTLTGISISRGGATTGGGPTGPVFSYRNLPPGRHTITARAAGSLWGSLDVDLAGEDVLGVVLRLERSVTISGRVVFESTGSTTPVEFTRVRVALRPPTPLAQPTPVGADGTFLVPGIDPGRVRVSATIANPSPAAAGAAAAGSPNAAANWVLKSVMWNGRDLADLPVDTRPGDALTDVVVTFSDRATELSGTLMDAEGRPAPGFYVAIFPTDPALWTTGSRRIPAPARAATDGRFRFAALPPGSYHAVALTNVDPTDLADTAFLKQLAAAAVTITLGEGEKKVQDLRFSSRR